MDRQQDCGYDLSDRENQEAVWTQFQRDGGVACPETGARLELDSEGGGANVNVSCPRCGRSGRIDPPDAREVQAWQE